MQIKKIKESKWKGRAVSEIAWGIGQDYGLVNHFMTLQKVRDHLMIEWIIEDDNGEEIDSAEIGIWTVGHDVTDYDGVFDIPKEAIKLLNDAGFNTKEIEVDENDKN